MRLYLADYIVAAARLGNKVPLENFIFLSPKKTRVFLSFVFFVIKKA